MNHIHALQARLADAERAVTDQDKRIDEFRVHLAGAKFQGFEHDGSRKDYIGAADVHRWLGYIQHGGL